MIPMRLRREDDGGDRHERHGDHVLIIGEVLHHSAHTGAPLLFHASRYRRLGDAI